jgi:hypothetical protein
MNKKYVILKMKGQRSTKLSLPLIIGRSTACDVFINSEALAEPVVVSADANGLQGQRLTREEEFSLDNLKPLGIRVLGPLTRSSSSIVTRFQYFAMQEKDFVSRLPRVFAALLGNWLPERWSLAFRFALLGLAVCIIGFSTGDKASQANTVDKSRVAITLPFDELVTTPIGASHKRKGYEKGAIFEVELSDSRKSDDLLLSFEAAGLNIGKELTITFNDHTIYESVVRPECIKSFCSLNLRISQNLVKANKQIIKISHINGKSSWFVSELLLVATPPISEVEREQVGRWMAIAERAFAEKEINPGNLVIVKRQLRQSRDFLKRKTGADTLSAKTEAFLREADAAFEQVSSDLWARARVAIKLKRFPEAIDHFHVLLRLYPDSSTREYRRIQEQLQTLKERLK